MELLKKFYQEEDGMGTVEIVMIIAALMCVALLFRNTLTSFVTDLIGRVMNSSNSEAGGNVTSENAFDSGT